MLPKMHKRWMHRELDREVVMQLEKPPRMMGLGIRPEKSSGDRSFGYFFFFTIYALGLMRIVVVVDEQHLMPPPPFVLNTAPSSTASTAFVLQHNTCPARLLHRRQRGLWSRCRQMSTRRLMMESSEENAACRKFIAYAVL